MRLACPNCDAQYEVPDEAIPASGRDVQCSNCGHTWFQRRPEDETAEAEEAALYGDDLPGAEPAAPAPVEPGPAAEARPDPTLDADAAAIAALIASDGPEAPPPVATEPPPASAALDESVLAVLREEAEREAEARRQEAQRAEARRAEAEQQMQVQPDLGMEAPEAPESALSVTQRRLAMLKGVDPDAAPPAPPKPATRRDLLPDVEEINSTLQPSEPGPDPDELVESLPDLTKGGGFRSGFFLMLFVAMALAGTYVFAPRFIGLVPALEGPLTKYVTTVDGIRNWLDEAMESATRSLTGGPEG